MEYVNGSPFIEEAHVKGWRIAGDPTAKNDVIEEILGYLAREGELSSSRLFRYRLCLDEALTNSVTHGCPGGAADRVEVDFYSSTQSWVLRVRDTGPGFDPADLPDPGAPEAELSESGRGLLILDRFADSLTYGLGGREVIVRLRLEHEFDEDDEDDESLEMELEEGS